MQTLPCRLDRSRSDIGGDEGAKNARDGGSHSGSGDLRPNGRWFERYGVKPIADRMGTLPVAQRSGHVLDRLTRCKSAGGAICGARAQPSAKTINSHTRCILPVTTLFEITS